MRLQAATVLLGLIGAATAASAQTRAPVPAVRLSPPTIYVAPTPTPLAPPTNPGPAIDKASALTIGATARYSSS